MKILDRLLLRQTLVHKSRAILKVQPGRQTIALLILRIFLLQKQQEKPRKILLPPKRLEMDHRKLQKITMIRIRTLLIRRLLEQMLMPRPSQMQEPEML